MKRREFVSQLAALLAGLGLGEAASKRDPAEYVGHALAGSAKLDTATLDDMAVVTARCRRAYRGLSVRKLLPQAHGHLAILETCGTPRPRPNSDASSPSRPARQKRSSA
jgi:hypothetical protein